MINVTEAKHLITKHIIELPEELQPLLAANNRILARPVYSSISMPPFKQSGMDGYAFRFQDFIPGKPLNVVNKVAAGNSAQVKLAFGEAVRIFTGAPVPDYADTVVMQEKTRVEDNQLFILDQQILPGQNVRAVGSDIMKGQLVMDKGTSLTPAAIGLLAGIGETSAFVYEKPQVAIVVTGDELQVNNMPLQPGQVYESNSFMLCAALERFGIYNAEIFYAGDSVEQIEQKLAIALRQANLVILTGGVSVGDHDFVVAATEQCGVQNIFHKIKQRPGKPLFFGKTANCLVFGLPGNPSSVLTCFYEYVLPTLQQMQGSTSPGLVKAFLPLAQPFTKNSGLTHFLKASCKGKQLSLLGAQESYKLNSFATANCLAVIPEEACELRVGDLVEVHFL